MNYRQPALKPCRPKWNAQCLLFGTDPRDIVVAPAPIIRAAFTKAWFTYKGIESLECTKCCIDVTQSGPSSNCTPVNVGKINKESGHDKGAKEAADDQNQKILKQIIAIAGP